MRSEWMLLLFASILGAGTSTGQPAKADYRREPLTRASGTFEGSTAPGARNVVRHTDRIQVKGAAWLRLHFGAYHLGEQSFITIKSVRDGSEQQLTARTMAEWGHASAIFNGDAVNVSLTVAPGDESVFFRIEEVSVGETVDVSVPESPCGLDDRSPSQDKRVGRIMPVGCTGWLISNGTYLTAGHCVGPDMQILEFNVPASKTDGTPVAAAPEDQYPIDLNSIVHSVDNLRIGHDWAIFSVFPNASTGLLPPTRQREFFRVGIDGTPASVVITGHGVDTSPAGLPPTFRNAQSQTQQSGAGLFVGKNLLGPSEVVIRYAVDTTGGNSGSPILDQGTGVTIGIHTNGGCLPTGGSNQGTGFENRSLSAAIENASGERALHVDAGHPSAIEDGTVFRPFHTVAAGLEMVDSGGTLVIVAGSYAEGIALDKAVTLKAPVGVVRIGNSH